ncbi:hypothetical protein EHQ24_19035 [Leptospira noumeaensis]|uniref:Lipoprotein n=1 Tax=Leptospira noumeaensis TaxID=2484964 RepID=A0A4R9HZT3_9LEPT|nr:hypothetical protein [Leptospira noumeaensis]TGK77573.1 hypothetical protein EHQ24_19035 [Leptospira noumeaensis]
MVVFRFILIISIISLFSCFGNFFPNEEETGEAAKERCAMSLLALNSELEEGAVISVSLEQLVIVRKRNPVS